jgi:hypothetical protein
MLHQHNVMISWFCHLTQRMQVKALFDTINPGKKTTYLMFSCENISIKSKNCTILD